MSVWQGLQGQERAVAQLRRSIERERVPHAYLLFEGEDHGFRSRDAIIRSFSAELSFYAQVFGFEPADDIEPLEIQFLEESRRSA